MRKKLNYAEFHSWLDQVSVILALVMKMLFWRKKSVCMIKVAISSSMVLRRSLLPKKGRLVISSSFSTTGFQTRNILGTLRLGHKMKKAISHRFNLNWTWKLQKEVVLLRPQSPKLGWISMWSSCLEPWDAKVTKKSWIWYWMILQTLQWLKLSVHLLNKLPHIEIEMIA